MGIYTLLKYSQNAKMGEIKNKIKLCPLISDTLSVP